MPYNSLNKKWLRQYHFYGDFIKEEYWDNRDIIKKFKCWNVSSGINTVIEKAKELNPELTFEVEDRWKDRIVQVIDVKTMEIVSESLWMTDAKKFMNCSRGSITRLLDLNEHRPKNGHAVRYKSEEPWNILPEEYECISECIQVTSQATGEKVIYSSKREIERELKISRFITSKHLISGLPYQNYLFKAYNKSA